MMVQESACLASLIRAATFTIHDNRLVLAYENGTTIHSYKIPDGTMQAQNFFSTDTPYIGILENLWKTRS